MARRVYRAVRGNRIKKCPPPDSASDGQKHNSFSQGSITVKLETFQAWAIKVLTAAILIEASVATALLIDWWWAA